MNTYLGVAETLAPADIDEGLMAATEWLLLEGYLFDRPGEPGRLRQGGAGRQGRRRARGRSPSPTRSASSATARRSWR